MMAVGYPDWSRGVITSAPNMEQKYVTVTDSETVVTFAQVVKSFLIYNAGNYNVYFSPTSGVTTQNFKIPSSAWYAADYQTDKLYFICDSGESTVLYIVAVY